MSSRAREYEKRREREEEDAKRERAEYIRWSNTWQVDEKIRHEYMALEDSLGETQAQAVLNFIKAFLGGEDE